MKWTGLSAVACAAMLTIACAGDARDERTDENRTAGTTGMYNDNDSDSTALGDHDDNQAGMETTGDARARIGGSVGDDQTRIGVGTSGQADTQAHGATGDSRHFVETASMNNNAEIQLAQLALERSQNRDVREFAQMMIRDHTNANNELKQVVRGQNITLSGSEIDQKHQQLMTRLKNLRGAEFDREYMSAMVAGHSQTRSMLQMRTNQQGQTARNDRNQGATGTTGTAARGNELDTAVHGWASKTLPKVEQHLQRAQQIQSSLGNAGNPTGRDGQGTSSPRPNTTRPGNN